MPIPRSEHRPGRFLKYSATLFVVVLLAYAGFLVSQSWREAKSEQAGQLTTIAALSENSIDLYFTQLKIGMQNLGADLAALRGDKSDLGRAFALVSRFQSLHTELDNVMLIRADGQILLTGAMPNGPELPSLAADPAFKLIREELQGSPFVISRPVTGHIDKSWVVSARYAVTDHAGKLAYIISANLPVDMMQRYWIDSITPRITALGLMRDDGYLVSVYPAPDAATQDALYGKPAEEMMARFPRTGEQPRQQQIEIRNDYTKTTSLLVLRRLQHYPLTLFVEMPVAEVKSAWWHDLHAPYFLMALVLACTFAFYSLRFQRRAWSAEKRRMEMLRSYEQALRERSPNEIFMFDTDTLQLTYANDLALEDLGYTLEQLQQKTILALHPESALESFGPMLEQLRHGGQESVSYQTVQVRANGSSYPVEVSLQLIKSEDGGEKFLAIVNDITARKQAKENIEKFNAPVDRRGSRNR